MVAYSRKAQQQKRKNKMSKKVSAEQWTTAMSNLQKRRDVTGLPDPKTKPYYCELLQKCYVGKTLLDVGCGNQQLKSCLASHVAYFGMDAFPIVPTHFPFGIDTEGYNFQIMFGNDFETVCAFAVLDGVRDFSLACQNMKLIAEKNVIILTGIGIPVDEFHTHRLELADFDTEFQDWNNTVKEEIKPKVWLLEFKRP